MTDSNDSPRPDEDPETGSATTQDTEPATSGTRTLWAWDGPRSVDVEDRYFHQYCSLDPRTLAAPPNIVAYADDDGNPSRTGLALAYLFEHAQLVVLVLGVALLAWATVHPEIVGVEAVLPESLLLPFGLAVGEVLLWLALVGLLAVVFEESYADDAETPRLDEVVELLRAFVVYGGLVVLVGGTAYAVIRVGTEPPTWPDRNIVYASGFLLLLYVGGPLVYDGMLRTETLFTSLHRSDLLAGADAGGADRSPGSERAPESDEGTSDRPPAYEEFVKRLNATLSSTVFGVPTALVIGGLFVLQYVIVWLATRGPFVLDAWPTVVVVAGVDVLIVFITVQFVVLVRFMNGLLRDGDATDLAGDASNEHDEHGPGDDQDERAGGHPPAETDGGQPTRPTAGDSPSTLRLWYTPAHEDGAGGFRDFGRFVTRVNSLLILAGLYLAYRLHVQGGRAPIGPFAGDAPLPSEALLWVFLYVVPVVVYIVVIGVWLYFSFWQLHRKMVREKTREIRTNRPGDGERIEDLSTLETFRNAPEWPVNQQALVTVVSLDALSVLVSLVALL